MALNIGCTARPGKSRSNRTGSWRVFRPVFRHDKCTKCGICALICPEGCIEQREDEFYQVNYEFCKGCGLCSDECPAEDVGMAQEEK